MRFGCGNPCAIAGGMDADELRHSSWLFLFRTEFLFVVVLLSNSRTGWGAAVQGTMDSGASSSQGEGAPFEPVL